MPDWRNLEPLEPRLLLSAAPVLDPIADDTASEAVEVQLSVEYNDADQYDYGHTATIDWGDGTVESADSVTDPYSYYDWYTYEYQEEPGEIAGSHTYADDGSYTVEVTVEDQAGNTDSETFQMTVDNVAPTLELDGEYAVVQSEAYTLSLSSEDGGDDTISQWEIDWGDGNTEAFAGDPASAQHVYNVAGDYTIRGTATDEDGSYSADPLEMEAIHAGEPVIYPVTDQSATEDNGLSIWAEFDDADNHTDTDASKDDTHTATIDWGDGVVEEVSYVYEPRTYETYDGSSSDRLGELYGSHTYADDGSYVVIVTVEDSKGDTDSEALVATVGNTPPEVSVSGNDTAIAGVAYTLGLSASDPGDDTISQWTIDWGDGSTETISGDPASVEHVYSSDGAYTISASAADEDGAYSASPKDVQVNIDSAPVLDPVAEKTIAEADLFELSAAFDDVDEGDAHTATIDWGDGTVETADVIEPYDHYWYGDQPGKIEGSHEYADDGSYTVTITVEDAAGKTDNGSFVASVNNTAPTLGLSGNPVIAKDGVYTLDLSAGDPGDDTISQWEIDWGDGNVETFAGNPDSVEHVYTSVGAYTISGTATDEDGTYVAGNTVGVDVAVNADPVITPIADETTTEANGIYLSVEFDDADNHGDTDGSNDNTHTATVDWGDGVVEPAFIAYEPNTYEYYNHNTSSYETYDRVGGIQGPSHDYADDGSYTIVVTVEDNYGGTDSASYVVTVNNTPPDLDLLGNSSAVQGELYTLDLAPSDPGDETISQWTIDWGDGDSATVQGNPASVDHVYSAAGTYTITGTATDEDGTHSANSLGVEVAASGVPVLDPVADRQGQEEGDVVNLTAWFSDASSSDSHTATIDWGDGTIDNDVEVFPFGGSGSGGEVWGSHEYTDEGSYSVVVSVEDSRGGVDSETFSVAVGDVAPNASISGSSSVDEGEVYQLDLYSSDPGDDAISQWEIDWGDGVIETFAGDPSLVEHVYADGANSYTISAQATDDSGTYSGGTQSVSVSEVAPTLSVDAPAVINEAAPYPLVLGYEDPGADALTWTIDWGDGSPLRTLAGDTEYAEHFYAAGTAGATVSVSASDEDGSYRVDPVTFEVAPAEPSGLTAAPLSDDQVLLEWLDSSAVEDGFKVERSTDGTNFTQVATVGGGRRELHGQRAGGGDALLLPRPLVQRELGLGILQHGLHRDGHGGGDQRSGRGG